nr:alcohol dehydrogenase catalytic domain-containing protein [uncultured Sphaerochaeta sp.]
MGELPPPGPGEARIRHDAIGLNFLDIYHRIGLYPLPLPLTPGSEGAGTVTEIGEGIDFLKPGDRVCYTGPIGAYAEERNIPAAKLIPIPDDISSEVAAATILKGHTVHYLLDMTADPQPGRIHRLPCRCRRRRSDRRAMGQDQGPACHRHRRVRRQGRNRQSARLRRGHQHPQDA